MSLFKELYAYRELLKTNIQKEIRGKYKGSLLGVLWSFINPLLQVAVYAIVFPYLMRGTSEHYLVYLITGIIPWTFFTSSINIGMQTVRGNAGIIKKVYFPRSILPISVVLSQLVNFLISCIIIVIFCLADHVGVSSTIFYLPVLVVIQTAFTLGLAFALSAINVYIKDIEYIVSFVLNMLFYGTPIIYQLSQFEGSAGRLVKLVKLNPLTHIMDGYRDIFLNHTLPSTSSMLYIGVLSVILLISGYFIFEHLQKGFAEEL